MDFSREWCAVLHGLRHPGNDPRLNVQILGTWCATCTPGERALLHVAGELKRNEQLKGDVMGLQTNVDHGGSGTTWGCPHLVLASHKSKIAAGEIIPLGESDHLHRRGRRRSRLGGFALHTFTRVAFLEKEVSDASTNTRGIFHTKDETLCASGFHRLHLICGESLCSETALWLNMGATALVVAMIEMGLCPGEAVGLANPLAAMQKIRFRPGLHRNSGHCYGRILPHFRFQAHYLLRCGRRISATANATMGGPRVRTMAD